MFATGCGAAAFSDRLRSSHGSSDSSRANAATWLGVGLLLLNGSCGSRASERAAGEVAEIQEIEATLKVAVIIDAKQQEENRVQIGSKVELTETTSNKKVNYQLVEPNEANPLASKISIVSPVGSAILGQKLGDEVKVKTPRGEQVYKISKTS